MNKFNLIFVLPILLLMSCEKESGQTPAEDPYVYKVYDVISDKPLQNVIASATYCDGIYHRDLGISLSDAHGDWCEGSWVTETEHTDTNGVYPHKYPGYSFAKSGYFSESLPVKKEEKCETQYMGQKGRVVFKIHFTNLMVAGEFISLEVSASSSQGIIKMGNYSFDHYSISNFNYNVDISALGETVNTIKVTRIKQSNGLVPVDTLYTIFCPGNSTRTTGINF
jgi:hypothetical protein